MKGCKYFTVLDLTWGFWALPIVEEDQHKTAFTGSDWRGVRLDEGSHGPDEFACYVPAGHSSRAS